jgi:hypothetical protein
VFLNVVEAGLWIALYLGVAVCLSLELRTLKRAHEVRCGWLTDPFTHLMFIIKGGDFALFAITILVTVGALLGLVILHTAT